MAKPVGKKPVNRIKLSASAFKTLDRLDGNSEKILAKQNDIDIDLAIGATKNSKLLNSINQHIVDTYRSFVGIGSEDYSSSEINQILTLSQKSVTKKTPNKVELGKQIETFKQSVSKNIDAQNLVMDKQRNKAPLYSAYDLILGIIPKMKLAVKTIANSVVSPDDFNKTSLSFEFSDNRMTDEHKENASKKIKNLFTKYDIEKYLLEDVSEYLVKGEKFWAILSMNAEVKRLLKENADIPNKGYEKLPNFVLNESTNTNYLDERDIIHEGMSLFSESKKEKLTEEAFTQTLNEFMTENFFIGDTQTFLMESQEVIDELESASKLSIPTTNGKNNSTDAEKDEKLIDGLSTLKTDTAILKNLLSENTVALEFDNKVYGYIYIDTVDNNHTRSALNNIQQSANNGSDSMSGTTPASQNSMSTAINGVIHSSNDITSAVTGESSATASNPKLKFIADAFVNRLSAKENIKLIRKNEQLKSSIYHTLLTKNISKNKVRVTFFTPQEVVHINRKESIFDNVLFFAKLYIATLVTILMQNIVRGADKRAYYVDVGYENDAANAINSVIRNIKTKDLSNVHNMDISSMLNVLGEFNDYYIPTIDGEKPIEISTVD